MKGKGQGENKFGPKREIKRLPLKKIVGMGPPKIKAPERKSDGSPGTFREKESYAVKRKR